MAKEVLLHNDRLGSGSITNGAGENGIQYMGFSPNYNKIQSASFANNSTSYKTDVRITFADEDTGITLDCPTDVIIGGYKKEWQNYVSGDTTHKDEVAVIPVYIALHNAVNTDPLAMEALAQSWLLKGVNNGGGNATTSVSKLNDSNAIADSSLLGYRYHQDNTFTQGIPSDMNAGNDTNNRILYNCLASLRQHAFINHINNKKHNKDASVALNADTVFNTTDTTSCYGVNPNIDNGIGKKDEYTGTIKFKLFPGIVNLDKSHPYIHKGWFDSQSNNNSEAGNSKLKYNIFTRSSRTYCFGGGHVSLHFLHFVTYGDTTTNGYNNYSFFIPSADGARAIQINCKNGIVENFTDPSTNSQGSITHYYAYFNTSKKLYADIHNPHASDNSESKLHYHTGYSYDSPVDLNVGQIACDITPIKNYNSSAVSITTPPGSSGTQEPCKVGVGQTPYIASFNTSFKIYFAKTSNEDTGVVNGIYLLGIDGILLDNTWARSNFNMSYGMSINGRTDRGHSHSSDKFSYAGYNGPRMHALLVSQQVAGDEICRRISSNNSAAESNMIFYANDILSPSFSSILPNPGFSISGSGGYAYYTSAAEKEQTSQVTLNNGLCYYTGSITSASIDQFLGQDEAGLVYSNIIRVTNNSNLYKSLTPNNNNLHTIPINNTSYSILNYGLNPSPSEAYAKTYSGLYNTANSYINSNASLSSKNIIARIGKVQNNVKIEEFEFDLSSMKINDIDIKYMTTSFPLEPMNKDFPNKIEFDINIKSNTTDVYKIGNSSSKLKFVPLEVYTEDLFSMMPDNPSEIYLPVKYRDELKFFNAKISLPLISIDNKFCYSIGNNIFKGADIYEYYSATFDENECPRGVYYTCTCKCTIVKDNLYKIHVTIELFNNSNTLGLFDLKFGNIKGTMTYNGEIPANTWVLSKIFGKILIKGVVDESPAEVMFNSNEFETTVKTALNQIAISSDVIFSDKPMPETMPDGVSFLPGTVSNSVISTYEDYENAIKITGKEGELVNFAKAPSLNNDSDSDEIPIDGGNILVINSTTGEVLSVSKSVQKYNREDPSTLVVLDDETPMNMFKSRGLTREVLPLISNKIVLY